MQVQTLQHIRNLINCLVNIKDETGEFLLTLEDGRVIDTKGWNDWEVRLSFLKRPASDWRILVDTWSWLVISSINNETPKRKTGLYGLWKFHEIAGDQEALDISLAWFKDRFEIGTTKVCESCFRDTTFA